MASVIAAGCLGLFWMSLFALSPFTIRQIDAWNGLFTLGREGGNIAYIVAQLRVPRALCAALVGACLGVAGALMQGITRNRLASPSLFGVTAGAALGLAGAAAIAIANVGAQWFGLLAVPQNFYAGLG